jgi:hypothetical protein
VHRSVTLRHACLERGARHLCRHWRRPTDDWGGLGVSLHGSGRHHPRRLRRGRLRRRDGRGWRLGRRRRGRLLDRRRSRRRRWQGLRCRSGRRRGGRWEDGGPPRREQFEWVDVPVLADPDTEMDVRALVLGVAGRTRVGDDVALRDGHALAHAKRSEMRQRRLVSVARRDRDRETVRRHLAGEGDFTRCGRTDRRRIAQVDVDPAMLARRVRVVRDRERPQNGPVRGPRPRERRRRRRVRPGKSDEPADDDPRCHSREHGSTVARVIGEGNAIDSLVTESLGTARSAPRR